MPKILVADDNSNIQKMVGLALKDQGIDVVAVGNGEAAVRKIADLRPDLVLADVFMPVRNGYEVCQFVKMDSSLAHIPVILLVGAFDPLDEQEAQRVGADGVLKKPFVPPDPLISMVKSALQRAGGGAVDTGSHKASSAPSGADLLTPNEHLPAPSVPIGGGHLPEPSVSLEQESFVDEIPVKPEPVQIDSAAQTVAFGSLLETPAIAEQQPEDDPSMYQTAHPELAADRDWRDPDSAEEEEEEEEEKPATWRHEDAERYVEATSAEAENQSKSNKASKSSDWRSGGFEQIKAGKGWEPEEQTPELVSSGKGANNSVAPTPPAPASVPEIPATDPDLVSSTQFVTETWTAPSTPAPQAKAPETATAVVEPAPVKKEEKSQEKAVSKPAPEVKPAEVPAPAKDSWFSVPSNPWNAEIEKANKLASTWDLPASPLTPAAPSGNGTEKATEGLSEETQKVIEEAALPAAAVEAIREEAAQVAEDASHAVEQPALDDPGSSYYATETLLETPGSEQTPAPEAAAPAAPAPADAPAAAPSMDDLVAKVLSKMSPDVLQAVTREILKPVVEAMVKEEMKPKK